MLSNPCLHSTASSTFPGRHVGRRPCVKQMVSGACEAALLKKPSTGVAQLGPPSTGSPIRTGHAGGSEPWTPPVRPPEFQLADLGGPRVGDPRRGQSRLDCPRLGSLTLGPLSSVFQQGGLCRQCSRLLARGRAVFARAGTQLSRAFPGSRRCSATPHVRRALSARAAICTPPGSGGMHSVVVEPL